MSDLCQRCLNAEWDSYSYHSSKECGLPGSSEQMVFCGCNRMDEIPEEVVTAIANCDDVEECPEYEVKKIAKQNHDERVAKTPDRIAYAEKQFKEHDIEYVVKNPATGHIHCYRKSDGKLFQFYASTGKIQGHEIRGIHALIKILER